MRKTQNSKQQNAPSKAMGEVRVIAGLWRGRKLPVLNAEGLRPTTDRVKETLFNWLMMDIANARCLDCFAGSGSLGIEALSRQAQAVVFLEKFATAAQQLKKNLTSLKAENALIYVETEKNHPPLWLAENWQIIKEKSAGMVTSRLIQANSI